MTLVQLKSATDHEYLPLSMVITWHGQTNKYRPLFFKSATASCHVQLRLHCPVSLQYPLLSFQDELFSDLFCIIVKTNSYCHFYLIFSPPLPVNFETDSFNLQQNLLGSEGDKGLPRNTIHILELPVPWESYIHFIPTFIVRRPGHISIISGTRGKYYRGYGHLPAH